jgi:hypothetical protein
MPSAWGLLGQGTFYGAVAAVIGYFAAHRLYRQVPDSEAQIKLPSSTEARALRTAAG